jgi:MinD superfamily P-loop ATPase
MIRELVIISGKGGTGKTSIAAAMACLAENKVIADCDVDAADLHLVLDHRVIEETPFEGGRKARVTESSCTGCGVCVDYCRFDALVEDGGTYRVDAVACEGCGVCARFCPEGAIVMVPHVSGSWRVSETPRGPLVHARLGIAEGNSGKLVTLIKKKARFLAAERGYNLVLVDGSPGTGCPVIATISGAALVLVVTEPTVSGLHDLERVLDLTAHFGVSAAVCVNKGDINPEMTEKIRAFCGKRGIPLLGVIDYDPDVTAAQVEGKSVVEYSDGPASRSMRDLWEQLKKTMQPSIQQEDTKKNVQ